MPNFLVFLKAFLVDFFGWPNEKNINKAQDLGLAGDFDCVITNYPEQAWDKGLFVAESLRLNTINFMENTPLVTVGGDINQAWAEAMSFGFPKLTKEEIQEALLILKQEQDHFVEVYLAGKEEDLPPESYLDRTIAMVAPNVTHNKESDQLHIMIHNHWLLYVPGISDRVY